MTEEVNQKSSESSAPELGRNEPCHCGSGKKFKRCHGVGAAPKLSAPKPMPQSGGGAGQGPGPGLPGGFDPNKMDPQMMLQFSQALQRLPRGQLQRLQGIMQRAMSGKDVRRESEEFERTLPPELQQLMISFAGQMQGMGALPGVPGSEAPAIEVPSTPVETQASSGEMAPEEARKIVAAAAAEGKISKEEAERLLANTSETDAGKKPAFGKFWRGITGKNS